MAMYGMPLWGTRWASMPEREPIQAQVLERSRSRAATARPGLVWPPVPPPAMATRIRLEADTRIRPSVLCGGPEMAPALPRAADDPQRAPAGASPAFEGEVDEAGDQLRVGDAGGFPQPRVGAGRGETRDRVDLVHEHAPLALDEEVHARHPRAVGGSERTQGERPHLFGDVGRQRGGHLERGLPRAVLGVVVVPLVVIAGLGGHR